MKALHLNGYFFPENSGTSTRLYNLISRLPYEISLITSDQMINGTLIHQKLEKIDNINIIRYPILLRSKWKNVPFLSAIHSIYKYYSTPQNIIDSQKSNRNDIVHVHSTFPFGEIARKIAVAGKSKFIFELHAVEEDSSKNIDKFARQAYLRKATLNLMNSTSHIITLTQSLKDYVCINYKINPEKVTVVPNGADIEFFSFKEDYRVAATRIKVNLGIRNKVVMYAGVIDHINGIVDLLKAIPLILQENSEICFVFVGSGPEISKLFSLSKLYPTNIICVGQVPYKEMATYYQMCDVFIIPRPSTTSSETIIPLKLLEVMAMEKTVLGSNVGGISEVVKDGYNGYLYEKENMDSFRKILFKALNADNSQIELNARKTIVENYTWEKSSKILEKVYEDLV